MRDWALRVSRVSRPFGLLEGQRDEMSLRAEEGNPGKLCWSMIAGRLLVEN